MYWRRKLQVYKHRWFESVDQHWTYFLSGSLNLIFENSKITIKRAMVQEDLHKISVHEKSHNTMYRIRNLEDTTNFTLSDIIMHDTNPHWPTFYIMVWRLKRERTGRLKLHLLINKIGYFMFLIFVKMLVTITCQEIQVMIIIPVLISHFTALLTKLIWVPIC